MDLTIYGAAQSVTGSQYLLRINGKNLLLECGMFQGRREDTYQKNCNLAYPAGEVDAAILSHAHIDHSGNLPNLVKNGYNGEIFTTEATAHLADVMLKDCGHIQEADAEFVNKKRARRGERPVKPIYTILDAERVANHFHPLRYGETFHPLPGVTAHLVDAGHILGSAAIVLDLQENGRTTRLWFSGDIGRERMPLMNDPVLPEGKVDTLLMECTYGDKPHAEPELAFTEFRDVVKRTVKRGGKIIIPAFAVGRTQELVYYLNQMVSDGDIPHIPVYVDSPLAVNATEVFEKFADQFDEETKTFIHDHKHPALEFPGLHYVQSVEESKKINEMHMPMIIISASGMAETGRILHHLKNNIEDPRSTILIVSWQAPFTLGRRLADRERKVRIYGEEYFRQAEIATIGGLSAHAGQNMLVKYASAVKNVAKQIVLVHGEPPQANALMAKLREAGTPPIRYPQQDETLEI